MTAVIGHGGSVTGRRWGAWIDQHHRVVRMWENAWQDAGDYGALYTHGIIETHPAILRRFYVMNQRQPSVGWVASYLEQFDRYPGTGRKIPPRTETVDQRQWIADPQLGGKIGGRGEREAWELTRGGFAGMWAIMTSAVGDIVNMIGCDNLRGGIALPVDEAFPAAYRRDPATASFGDYVVGAERTGNHHFAAERDLLELYAQKRMVSLRWAE